jgi:hypothetical protein
MDNVDFYILIQEIDKKVNSSALNFVIQENTYAQQQIFIRQDPREDDQYVMKEMKPVPPLSPTLHIVHPTLTS